MGLEGRPAITLQALNALRKVPDDRYVKTIDEAQGVARRLLGV